MRWWFGGPWRLAGLLLCLLLLVAAGAAAALPPDLLAAPDLALPAAPLAPLPALSPPDQSAVAPPGARAVYRFPSGGRWRAYVVVGSRTGAPRPLLVALPGLGQSALQAERIQGWDGYALRRQAIVVYGSGYGGAWAAGSCCTTRRSAAAPPSDDVAYLDRVLRAVAARYPVDPRRVYLVGFSNGGMMAYRYACERAQRLAAVAVVAGTLAYPACRPTGPLDVLAVHGSADRTVPLAGTRLSRRLHVPLLPPAAALRPWQQAARGTPARVRFVVVPGLTHHWPRRPKAARIAGTAVIWDFLAGARRPDQRAAAAARGGSVGRSNAGASGRGRYRAT